MEQVLSFLYSLVIKYDTITIRFEHLWTTGDNLIDVVVVVVSLTSICTEYHFADDQLGVLPFRPIPIRPI